VYEQLLNGKPVLELFAEAIPKGGSLGMVPKLNTDDALALRDYLNDWLSRNSKG
jgi:hypothetical protein